MYQQQSYNHTNKKHEEVTCKQNHCILQIYKSLALFSAKKKFLITRQYFTNLWAHVCIQQPQSTIKFNFELWVQSTYIGWSSPIRIIYIKRLLNTLHSRISRNVWHCPKPTYLNNHFYHRQQLNTNIYPERAEKEKDQLLGLIK